MNTKAPYGYTLNEKGTGYEINPEKAAELHHLTEQGAKPTKRAAIYARTATSQEHNGLLAALQEQINQAQAYCVERGYALDAERHIYQEVASGASKGNRPQLTALRQAANEGQFTILVVSSFDRLARSSIERAAIINDLMQAGITVESVQEPSNDNDALLLATSILASVERLMSERLWAHTQHGKAAKKAPQEQ